MKKIVSLLVGTLCSINIISCGTPRLEDKTQEANYTAMINKAFEAKYTYLNNATYEDEVPNKFYPDKKAIRVHCNDTENYTLVVDGCDKNANVCTKFGSKIQSGETINITKAEVVAESLGDRTLGPTLVVSSKDIEKVEEKEFEDILSSNKTYNEIPQISTYMIDLEGKYIGYDEKYQKRVDELLKSYKEEKEKFNEEQKKEEAAKSTPQNLGTMYTAKYGEIKEAIELNNCLTIKFKIQPNMTNKLTIEQNGYNVEDLILNQGADKYETISYWAVADMTDGSEGKVISFTVNKNLISKIKNKQVVGNEIIDYVDDVWILPSLQK